MICGVHGVRKEVQLKEKKSFKKWKERPDENAKDLASVSTSPLGLL